MFYSSPHSAVFVPLLSLYSFKKKQVLSYFELQTKARNQIEILDALKGTPQNGLCPEFSRTTVATLRYNTCMFDLSKTSRLWLFLAIVSLASSVFADEPYQGRLFDAHVHYSHQTWDVIDTETALRLLDKVGITAALTSSTPDEGTLKLMHKKHTRVHIVPFYRPYKENKDRVSWFKNLDRLRSAEETLETGEHMGFGEIHIHAPINIANEHVQDLIRRVADRGLFIQVHADHGVITRIFEVSPNSKIIWAHAGFDPTDVVARMMDKHENLWADLSLREFGTLDDDGIIDVEGINPKWKSLLIRHADRFMIGSDTYNVGRWLGLPGIINENRMWLGHLPKYVADQIAHQNGERLFGRPK